MVPIVVFLICVGWRILKRRKADEKEYEENFLTVKPIDPDESVRINSDDDSIPYKKDITEDSPEPEPEPTDAVRIVDNIGIPYDPSYDAPVPPVPPVQPDDTRARQWAGETEIN